MMASIRSAIRAYAHDGDDVATVVALANRHLCRDTLISEFATLFYGVFSPDGRKLTYCSAGHTPPLLARAGSFTELTVGGMVIGVNPEEHFDSQVVDIHPGDLLAIITDGVTEAMDFDGRAYGVTRLRESIIRQGALDAQQCAQQLLWDVRRFVGLASQSDDITVVVVKAS